MHVAFARAECVCGWWAGAGCSAGQPALQLPCMRLPLDALPQDTWMVAYAAQTQLATSLLACMFVSWGGACAPSHHGQAGDVC